MTNSVRLQENEVSVSVLDEAVNVNVTENIVEVSLSETGPQGPRGTQVLSGTGDPSNVFGLVGDLYINTTTGFLFGPKTAEYGWSAGVLLGSGLQISDVSHTFYQTTPSSEWIITHNLGFNPSITVVDLSGNVVEGDYRYINGGITATFSEAITGAAYLS